MNRFHILTLFPEMVMDGLNTSIIGRAIEAGLLEINAVNIRDYSTNKHMKVDDYPYGGGAGLVMQPEPVYRAYEDLTKDMKKKPRVVYLTPQGTTFHQEMAKELAKEEELVFLCGHYEGIDERVLEEIVTDYVSIGDYVLTGGELPAMVMIDSISRLVPGVLHNDDSAGDESFENGLLEYPQYTRPPVFLDKEVPEVLLSGHHENIRKWRHEQSVKRTKERRPDLWEAYEKGMEEKDEEERLESITGYESYNLNANTEIKTINCEEVNAKGRIIGGCFDLITEIAGTKYDGINEFNEKYQSDGIIWYFDNCEESLENVIRHLWKLNELGYFKYAKAIIFGRFGVVTSNLGLTIKEALNQSVITKLNIPIIYDANISHKGPCLNIINGSIATINFKDNKGTIKFEIK
mgnify:CR=1 FL=1